MYFKKPKRQGSFSGRDSWGEKAVSIVNCLTYYEKILSLMMKITHSNSHHFPTNKKLALYKTVRFQRLIFFLLLAVYTIFTDLQTCNQVTIKHSPQHIKQVYNTLSYKWKNSKKTQHCQVLHHTDAILKALITLSL